MGRKRKEPHDAVCANCGTAFETTRAARFCAEKCRYAFNARARTEGAAVIAFVKAWIAGKGGGRRGSHPVAGKCLTEITSIVRILIEADKAANRPSPIPYVESLFHEGYYIDRNRRG